MARNIARKTDIVVLRETRGFHFNKITVHFDSPAGLSGERTRKLLPIFPWRSGYRIVGVRAFGGLWEVEARVVAPRYSNGRLMRTTEGKIPRARFIYHAKHVAWLDENKLKTKAQMADALARVAHTRHYLAVQARLQAA